MTARSFLVRGLLIGLLSGFAAFLVAHQVGEPHLETAIALEEAATATADATGDQDVADVTVTRPDQRTWGLLTGALAVGTVLGGFVALLSAAAVGRMGRLTAVQSTVAVVAVSFVSYSLVPFLKYPATPPAIGAAGTVGSRTSSYFAIVLLSVVVAFGAVLAARAAADRLGGVRASVAAVLGYVVVISGAAALLPGFDTVGDFPADTLWSFRLASLLTLAAMWAVIGIGLTLVVDRMSAQQRATSARQQLAASL